jgi:hypothetical protein
MGQISNSQSFIAGASGVLGTTAQQNTFKRAIDSVMVGLGRDFTIHLPPAKSPCTSTDCRYNSMYERWIGANNKACEACRGQGFTLEPRWTVYRGNIRWTDEAFNESTTTKELNEVGRIGQNFVRTKTVYSSLSDVRSAIGATIDGIDVLLHNEPRVTGFGDRMLYVVTFWKVANK